MNPRLFILERSILVENEDKLRVAGANRVMSPYVMGGRRMAAAVLRPNVLDFFELAMQTDDAQIVIEKLTVQPGSDLIGGNMANCRLRMETGAAVIAIKKTSGKMLPNPPDEEVIDEGDVLIALGTPQQLSKVEKVVCPGSSV